MHRFSKLILIAAGIVLGLVVLSFIGANLYLQSTEVQARIRSDVERAIGAPLKIRGTSLTPWSGLTLSHLAVMDPANTDAHLFEARSLNAKLNWWKLLGGRVEVTSVTLNEPILVLNSNQGIVLPSPRQDIPAGVTALPPAETAIPPETNPPSVPAPPAAPGGSETRQAAPLRIAVKHFGLRNGTVILRDEMGRPEIEIHGLRVDSQIASETDIRGTVQADDIWIIQRFLIRRSKADYTLAGDQLNLSPITAEFAQGAVKGIANVNVRNQEASLAVTLDQASVQVLLQDAGFPSEGSSGNFGGNLELAGILGNEDSYAGQGEFNMVSGTLQPLEVIRKAGEILNIDELQLLRLEAAHLQVTIGDRKTQIDELTLKSKNLILSGKGPVRFDGRLNLDAQLKLNEKLQRNLQGLLNRNFVESDLPGYKQVSFKVTGTLARPNTDDFFEKVTGIRGLSNEVGNFLQGLFRKPKPAPSPKAAPTP